MYLENGMTVRSRYDFAMIRARRRRLTGGRNDDRAERRKKYNRKEVNTMPRLSKKVKAEWAFFLHPQTGRRTYNEICRSCIHECKQSFRAPVSYTHLDVYKRQPGFPIASARQRNGSELPHRSAWSRPVCRCNCQGRDVYKRQL